MTEMNEKLQDWFVANQPRDTMMWKKSFEAQVFFVRDRLASILSRTYEQHKDFARVIGTHMSKSIFCPVYKIDLPEDHCTLIMRDNFYDWNISVSSRRPLICNFLGTFDDRNHSRCCCEGMEQYKHGPYANDPQLFTVSIGSDYDLYTFGRVLKDFFKIVPRD